MSLIQPTRRALIGALVTGPAIVRVASLMPVRALPADKDPFTLKLVERDGREYLQIRYKGEDGIVRSSFLSVL